MEKFYNLFLLVLLIFCLNTLKGQVSGYTFSSVAGSYVPITGGTNLPSTTTTYLDDENSTLSNIGFTFNYNGVNYTQFGFNANGFIRLGSTTINTNLAISDASGGNNVIAAMGNNLIGRGSLLVSMTMGSPIFTVSSGDINLINVGDAVSGSSIVTGSIVISKTATTVTLSANATSTGSGRHFRFVGPNAGIRYETIGSAPNRKLVVQWTGFQRFTSTGAFGELYNFQIVLNETSNNINTVYNILGPTSATATAYQIGLRGASNADFNNRTTTSDWSATTAGGANTATITLSNTVFPSSGLTYTWAAASCVAPSALVASSINISTATIGWTASGSALTYDWEIRTTGSCGSGAPIQSGTTAATSVNLTSLTGNTTYTYCVRSACSGSNTSGWVSGTFTTACGVSTIPYSQDFESAVVPAIPPCTSIQNAGTGNNWKTSSNPGDGFTSKTLEYTYNSVNDANAWFFTQGLILTAGTNYKLTYRYGSAGYEESLKVNIGTSPNAAAMTTNLADHPLVITSPFTNTVYFSVPSNGTYYVGYNAYSIADQYYLYVDDIKIIVAPSCDVPSNIVASAITQNSAIISWTAPAPPPANGYDYIYTTSTTPPTGMSTPSGSTIAGITTANLTSLTSNTLYYVWLRSVCSGVDKSTWVAMPSFTTLAAAPTNDDCAGAVTLTVTNGLPTSVVVGSIAGATISSGIPSGTGCNDYSTDHDIWYKFVVPTTGNALIEMFATGGTLSSNNDYSIQAFSGSCGSLAYVSCDDDGSVYPTPSSFMPALNLTGQSAGTTLYLRVRKSLGSTQLTFSIGVSDPSVLIPVATGECLPSTVTISPASGNAFRFVPLLDASGGIVAEIYPYGQNLGVVTSSMHHNVGVRTDAQGIKYMEVDHTISVQNQPSSSVDVALYISTTALSNLVAADPSVTLATLKSTKTSNACGSNPGTGGALLTNYNTFTRIDGVSGVAFSPTSFSTFYLHGGLVPLPVNILSFDAKSLNNKTVQLTWNVAAEVDVKEYVVERSNDNRNWSAIGSVKANQKSTYGFNDNSPVSGVNYYRLAVKDVNASVAYSDIRTVNFSGKGNMALYPNPANNTLYVSGTDDKNVVVSIYNEVGQIVTTLSSNGETIRTGGIDVSQLLPGAYSLQVKGESGLTTMRFVKQ
ncbi:fibronectin type III domain-containing protein [Candidatus Brachybacter algidus]|jgi:hypothetical protein|uniref:fibronectin type III domain-containing protein n=1 Tax=Candidatus Brachybacter algidus TaxID=2982024 RepID=UPI001D983AE9|nr:fibronectin type III domain-containing protein [Candidatus Brachybacter algidus]MBK6448996.1 fibronectin type III domain-containing protein [Candidatus Brachybacter algidus]